jgi:hypothetical protein
VSELASAVALSFVPPEGKSVLGKLGELGVCVFCVCVCVCVLRVCLRVCFACVFAYLDRWACRRQAMEKELDALVSARRLGLAR